MMKRRNFLTGAGLLAAAALLPGSARAGGWFESLMGGGGQGAGADPAYQPSMHGFFYTGGDSAAEFRQAVDHFSADRFLFQLFVTSWCPYCKAQLKYLGELTEEKGYNISVLALDVEGKPNIAQSVPRRGNVPDNYYYLNGDIIGGFVGAASSADALGDYIREAATKQGIEVASR